MPIRPYISPLPILGLSASGLLLAAAISSTVSRAPISRMSSSTTTASNPTSWPTRAYQPQHAAWPYAAADFARQDSSSDGAFYAAPRLVTHIDDAAIAALRAYYAAVLPRRGRILDFCSSWVSHYPREVAEAAAAAAASSSSSSSSSPDALRVVGLGMNRAELEANGVLSGGRIVHDLNAEPDVGAVLRRAGVVGDAEGEKLDAATNVVSIDYLTRPVEVLSGLREVTRTGGSVHLVVSNRCFPTKAIARWLRVAEDERLEMVGDYLHFAGWSKIEIVELSNGTYKDDDTMATKGTSQAGMNLRSLMGMMGVNTRDPLWVVRAVNQ